eukprot:PhF_6_TR24750/c0_g1_i1/m.33927/K20777/EXD2; exonuclease 3'-5' domain-containing protein 2
MEVLVIDPLHYRSSVSDWSAALDIINQDILSLPILGIDMEWTTTKPECESPLTPLDAALPGKPVKQKRVVSKVAVIQISTQRRCVVLRWCNIVNDPTCAMICHDVTSLLQNSNLFKTGVGILGDRSKIKEDFNIDMGPCVELSVLRRHVEGSHGPAQSLKQLAQDICNHDVLKDIDVIMSDWANGSVPLNDIQIQYAAQDAKLSYHIAETLLKTSLTHSSSVEILHVLHCVANRAPKTKTGGLPTDVKESHAVNGRMPKNITKDPSQSRFTGRKNKYYHNIKVIGPDGVELFTVDKSKAEWYVTKKDLAHVIQWRDSEDGSTQEMDVIQLKFSPDFGRYNDGHLQRNRDYFLTPKDNRCVV